MSKQLPAQVSGVITVTFDDGIFTKNLVGQSFIAGVQDGTLTVGTTPVALPMPNPGNPIIILYLKNEDTSNQLVATITEANGNTGTFTVFPSGFRWSFQNAIQSVSLVANAVIQVSYLVAG